jgi:ribonuclease-3
MEEVVEERSSKSPEEVGDGRELASQTHAHALGAPPRRSIPQLQAHIGYTFKDPALLENALVHKSYLYAVPDAPIATNERLEFLGDAVLGLLASDHLFATYPDVTEGELSALRGTLVRLNTLAEIAAPLELGEYMHMSRGEEAAGGRNRPSNLGRALEALLGAAYLDGGLDAARAIWTRALGERSLEQMQQILSADYKSKLQQEAQSLLRETPRYRLVETTGPDHARVFKVEVLVAGEPLAEGAGRNKQIAEQEAARAALPLLERLAPAQAAAEG